MKGDWIGRARRLDGFEVDVVELGERVAIWWAYETVFGVTWVLDEVP